MVFRPDDNNINKMEREFLVNLLLTLGVVGSVILLGGFLSLSFLSKRLGERYISVGDKNDDKSDGKQSSLLRKVSDWYLSKGALPFWYIFGIDCLILVFSQQMASYLMLGGQVLVPLFWDYFVLALCSLPFYYLGMKMFRSYETIIRFSRMEDLARIVCAIFVGTVMVDLVKHFVPESILPVYPLWQEQLVMLICAVILMWSVRILVKSLYDNTGLSRSKTRSFIYGTSFTSIQLGLDMRRNETSKSVVVAFVRANDNEPHTTIEGAEILNPKDNIVDAMAANKVDNLIVPYSSYPDFVDTHKDLVMELVEKKIAVFLR